MLWLNGALLDPSLARIDPADRGFTLGDGVFETIAVLAGIPRFLDQHLTRLRNGADLLGIRVPYDDKEIAAAITALLSARGLTGAALRITLSHGPGARGLAPPDPARPTLMITAAPLPPPLPPARAIIARTTCRNQHSPLARIKSLNYLDNILARREATARGGDEAILLNTEGRVAEASIANLFAVIAGVAITPPVAEGALPGIRRQEILSLGMAVERPLTVADLHGAEEIFLTSSLAIRPVAALDGTAVGNSVPGPITRAIIAASTREDRG